MSSGSMEQRTEGMKKQAQELIEFAYQRGVKAGHEEMQNQMHEHWEKKQKELIEQGRNEAWEAARKVIEMGEYSRKWEVFPELGDGEYPFDKLSASEAIARIKAYDEQKKQKEDEEIKVGDEVVTTGEYKGVVIKISNNDVYLLISDLNNMPLIRHKLCCKKTGRTFPEIAEVLKKMQENVTHIKTLI